MRLFALFMVLVMVFMALSADYLLKIAGTRESMFNRYFFVGMIMYTLTAFVWYFVLRNIKFSEANLLYSLMTVLLSVLIGVVFLREHLNTIEVVAVFSAVASIVVLSRFS